MILFIVDGFGIDEEIEDILRKRVLWLPLLLLLKELEGYRKITLIGLALELILNGVKS